MTSCLKGKKSVLRKWQVKKNPVSSTFLFITLKVKQKFSFNYLLILTSFILYWLKFCLKKHMFNERNFRPHQVSKDSMETLAYKKYVLSNLYEWIYNRKAILRKAKNSIQRDKPEKKSFRKKHLKESIDVFLEYPFWEF